jgi:hypothetical protein
MGGRLYVSGGARGYYGPTKTLLVYKPASNSWVKGAEMPDACGGAFRE